MAKFLPFVVEKSTPIHIFQTLMSRSKGMNNLLVASIFYLVLEKGITLVRETASLMSDDLDTGQLYDAILNTHPSHRITIETYTKIQSMLKLITLSETFLENIHEDLREHTLEDILIFICVIIAHEPRSLVEYTQLDFNALFDGRSDTTLSNVNRTKLFANDCPQVAFADSDELKAYITYNVFISPVTDEYPGPVTAVYGVLPEGAPAWKPKPKPNRGPKPKAVPPGKHTFSRKSTDETEAPSSAPRSATQLPWGASI